MGHHIATLSGLRILFPLLPVEGLGGSATQATLLGGGRGPALGANLQYTTTSAGQVFYHRLRGYALLLHGQVCVL